MKRIIGLCAWLSGIAFIAAPIAGAMEQTGCGGCYGSSCPCADGTNQPTKTAPCSCDGLCSSHGGTCATASCTSDSGGSGDAIDEATACGVSLCVHGSQPPECPSCTPHDGDNCSPPAAITCNYTNGCTGGQLESSQCTCELPDASSTSDAGDAGDASAPTKAIWSCKLGA